MNPITDKEIASLQAQIAAAKAVAKLPLEYPNAKCTYCAGWNEALEEVWAAMEDQVNANR